MKEKIISLFLFVFILAGTAYPGKDKFKYFRIDKIISVSGKIIKIKMEESYRKNKFIIFELKELKSDKIYDVEVSPQWFYGLDVAEGSMLEVKGSLNVLKERNIVLAQSIIFEGEVFNFRDKFGFPLWRGKRQGYGNTKWKGEKRRKGKR